MERPVTARRSLEGSDVFDAEVVVLVRLGARRDLPAHERGGRALGEWRSVGVPALESQRVARYLLSHCAPDGRAVSFRLPYQKSLLAGKLGLAPEALSRAFSLLRNHGVNVRGRLVQITDPEALRRI